jgi:predicted DNA-binding transcriptional regulator YafY
MGRRSASETIIAILGAFIEQRCWAQAELAEHVGITVEQLRKHLKALSLLLPFGEPERDHPHVYWTLPNHWFPGGVALSAADADEVLRQLARAPESDRRNAVLLTLARSSGRHAQASPTTIAIGPSLLAQEKHLRELEDAGAQRKAVALTYYSASRGDRQEGRHLSVQRILVGPSTRFVAHCHRSGELRFFRLSRVDAVRITADVPYVAIDAPAIDTFIAGSVSGYRDPSAPVAVAFVVGDPDAHWVKDTLPLALACEPAPGGLRFSGETAGVLALARFVVGLGDAARVETPELLAAVLRLAHGSLEKNTPTIRSVAPIRATASSTRTS